MGQMLYLDAVVEALRAREGGIVDGYELSPAVDDGCSARTDERRGGVHDAVGAAVLTDASARNLCLDTLVGKGESRAKVEAYDVHFVARFHVTCSRSGSLTPVFCFAFTLWCGALSGRLWRAAGCL